MDEVKKLEVGDVIFTWSHGNYLTRSVVDRVTEKYAGVGKGLYDRVTLKKRGGDNSRWNRELAARWSQKLQDRYDAERVWLLRKTLAKRLEDKAIVMTRDQVVRITLIIDESVPAKKTNASSPEQE